MDPTILCYYYRPNQCRSCGDLCLRLDELFDDTMAEMTDDAEAKRKVRELRKKTRVKAVDGKLVGMSCPLDITYNCTKGDKRPTGQHRRRMRTAASIQEEVRLLLCLIWSVCLAKAICTLLSNNVVYVSVVACYCGDRRSAYGR